MKLKPALHTDLTAVLEKDSGYQIDRQHIRKFSLNVVQYLWK